MITKFSWDTRDAKSAQLDGGNEIAINVLMLDETCRITIVRFGNSNLKG